MANTKISALIGAATPLAGTEVLPIVQSGTTVKVSVANLTVGRSVATGPLTATHTSGAGVTVTRGTKSLELSGNYAGGDVFSAITATTGMDIALLSGGSEILRAVNTGNVNINNGNLVPSTAAKGVNFTANTPAAGMTSQLLNWYEEGTWTPVPTSSIGSITSYTSSGRYTRIGRAVVLSFKITITNNGTGSGVLFATGMPFAASAVNLESGTIAEVAVVGFSGYTVFNTTTKLSMGKYDNTYAGGTNYVIVGQITYQI